MLYGKRTAESVEDVSNHQTTAKDRLKVTGLIRSLRVFPICKRFHCSSYIIDGFIECTGNAGDIKRHRV